VLTKKEIADHLRFTPRYIDQLIAQGMPHMKIGKRRCRFFKDEVDQWMRDRFATRRIGRVNPQPTEAA
jgi:excisionase family DNA binding protein